MFPLYTNNYKFKNLLDSQVKNFIKWYKNYGQPIYYYQVDKVATEVKEDTFYGDKIVPRIKLKSPILVYGRLDLNEFLLETELFGYHLERQYRILLLDALIKQSKIVLTVGDVLKLVTIKGLNENLTFDIPKIKGDIIYEIAEVQPHNYIVVPNTVFEWSLLIKRVDNFDFTY